MTDKILQGASARHLGNQVIHIIPGYWVETKEICPLDDEWGQLGATGMDMSQAGPCLMASRKDLQKLGAVSTRYVVVLLAFTVDRLT